MCIIIITSTHGKCSVDDSVPVWFKSIHISPFYSPDVVFTYRTYTYEYTWEVQCEWVGISRISVWMTQCISDFSVNDLVSLWFQYERLSISLISVRVSQYVSNFSVNYSVYLWFQCEWLNISLICEQLSISLISVWMSQYMSDFSLNDSASLWF